MMLLIYEQAPARREEEKYKFAVTQFMAGTLADSRLLVRNLDWAWVI
jgi:hypothetical protein